MSSPASKDTGVNNCIAGDVVRGLARLGKCDYQRNGNVNFIVVCKNSLLQDLLSHLPYLHVVRSVSQSRLFSILWHVNVVPPEVSEVLLRLGTFVIKLEPVSGRTLFAKDNFEM